MENNMILDAAQEYLRLEAYGEVKEEHVKEIRRLLKQQNLTKTVNIEYEGIELDIEFNNISKYYPSEKIRRFHMDDNIHPIKFEGKPVELYMYIGGWSNSARINNSHISIYTNSNKIGGERFLQIELSDCIEDDNYVYMLKNVSKNAGSGAISRLNKYSYPTTEREKREADLRKRREELVRRTYSEVINYDDNDWVCIYKFDKKKLLDPTYHEELFNDCIERIIDFTFAMESIVIEAKKFETTQTTYVRNEFITEYANRRADGVCQLCREDAPFNDKKGRPYLEVHHVIPLSEGGEDSIKNTVALCPNCHRKIHSLGDIEDVRYLKYIAEIEDIEDDIVY